MDSSGRSDAKDAYKRSYVACHGCRSRKVRCLIETEPPCARCKREHRDCTFNDRAKSYKGRHPPKWAHTGKSRDLASVHSQTSPRGHGVEQSASGMNPTANLQTSPSAVSDRMISTVTSGSADALNLLFDSARPDVSDAPRGDGNISPIVSRSTEGIGFTITTLSDPEDEVLDMWDRCRFVRQGWFTAQEAVTYVDLFHEKVAPLCMVDLTPYRPHPGHRKLVFEEAMLCCTVLTIASRLFTLPGAGGVSRSHNNHRRLWNHCELLLKRTLLGQEKHSTAKIRVLGTIESLLLISDWPPRAINFPPETEGFDADLISPAYDRVHRRQHVENAPLIRWREDVFEPANRAEKMTWMLLGVAVNLAHELGLFSESIDNKDVTQEARKWRLRKLLHVYVSQASIRMRIPSTLPDSVAQLAGRPPAATIDGILDARWIATMDLWMELTKLSATASAMFFQSASHTKTQLLNGTYVPLLEHLLSSMTKWHEALMSCDIEGPMKDSLLLEHYHLKACSAAVAVQAVVEKAAVANAGPSPKLDAIFTTQTTSQDARFLSGVAKDAGEVLRLAALSSFKEHLPFVPTRLRIFVVSSSVFLLKAICVGSRTTASDSVLLTLEQSARALQTLAPDDMCFASRSAMLIEKQTSRLRQSLVPNRDIGEAQTASHSSTNTESNSMNGQQTFEFGLPNGPDQDSMGGMMNLDAFDSSGLAADGDAWMTLPYDYNVAPFSTDTEAMSFGFEIDSLDFLWALGS